MTNSEKQSREQFEVIREPTDSSAGLGVRYRPGHNHNPDVTVEQLWPNGESDPIYVKSGEMGDLIHELMRVHLEIMEDD